MLYPQKELRLNTLQHRLARTQSRLAELRKTEGRFPWIRLGTLLILLLIVFLALQLLPLVPAWIVIFLALGGFAVVARLHQRVIDRTARLEAFQRLLESHIARLGLNWPNIPSATPLAVSTEHPFAADLNVTGERSLHQLLDTSISLGGSQRLADWLLNTRPDPAQIDHRQALARELIELPAFRIRLELNGMMACPANSGRWDGSGLLRWLETHRPLESLRPRLVLLSILAAINIILFALNAFGLLPALWIWGFLIYFAVQSLKYRQTSEVFEEAYTLARQLGQLRQILTDLESYPYDPQKQLAQVAAPFCANKQCPSTALRQIGQIVSAASLRNNPFLSLLLNILMPWDLFFAYQLERYKRALQGLLPAWLEAWYEMEALSALANYAALNPETTFPAILAVGSKPVFEGEAIGHPLIPYNARVSNNFAVRQLGEVTIITGSNMSGKSTFLRTVGANLVLAYAGCATPSKSLRALPFRLYTSMNLADSLSDGISFFYAEVRRLKALLDALEAKEALPLFFLIDEIFSGTNNRERQIGSHAYTKALAGHHGAGLISTHDLELAHLEETIPLVRNLHFREDIQGEKMVFDYKIRPGASPTTNALKIMALAGLPSQEGIKNP